MIVHTYKIEEHLDFVLNSQTTYKSDQPFESLHPTYQYGLAIFPDYNFDIAGDFLIDENRNLNNLRHTIVFLRFRVPYDDKYRYKIQTFVKGNKVVWNLMAREDQSELITRFTKIIENSSKLEFKETIKDYLKDFEWNHGEY